VICSRGKPGDKNNFNVQACGGEIHKHNPQRLPSGLRVERCDRLLAQQ
jgi:hypothetical protein